MARVAKIKAFTIPNGGTTSNILDAASDYLGLGAIVGIIAPAVLDALTFTLEVSQDGSTFSTLTSDGAASITLPGAGKAKAFFFEVQCWSYVRIKSSGAVAADRVFLVSIQESASE